MTESWEGKSIVIVDDSMTSRDMLKNLYESVGLNVIADLTSGLEALEKIPELLPDFVSLDIIMPEMDGIECYFRLMKLSLPSFIFFVSPLSFENRMVEVYAEQIPPEVFLPKPLVREALVGLLDKRKALG